MAKATSAEKRHMNKVAAIGCIVCHEFLGVETPAIIHHVRDGLGIGQRNHKIVLPICPGHHKDGGFGVAIHDGQEEWEKNFYTEQRFLEILEEKHGIKYDK